MAKRLTGGDPYDEDVHLVVESLTTAGDTAGELERQRTPTGSINPQLTHVHGRRSSDSLNIDAATASLEALVTG